jgi:hypothetical protein
MAYAENTEVAVEKSIGEIVGLIKRAGADRVAQYEEPGRISIQFFLHERLLKFTVRLPSLGDLPTRDHRGYALTNEQMIKRRDQRHRQRARALLLVIKAKLESVESGVESFEEAFLANVVMSDGQTLYERVAEPIALEYQTGEVRPNMLLLGGPSNG